MIATDLNTGASLDDMQAWADNLMASRAPDFIIGENYLRRWWVIPRNAWSNIYLHEFGRSDDDRALHDHPWANTSFLIRGRCIEHTPQGKFFRTAGEVISRPAHALHRIELFPGERPVSLFFTRKKTREWGFACPKGWVHWRDFTAGANGELVGKGCGE